MGESEAFHSLVYDDQIIIKPGDKCSTIVVWNKDDYMLEAFSQLSDTKV